jgi:membrane protein
MVAMIRRVVRQALHHKLRGESAKTAYYLFLSLFPLLLVVFALTGILGGHAVFDVLAARLEQAAPPEGARYVERFVRDVTDSRRPDILSFGLLLGLWTGSNIFVALTEGLNRVYEIRESRRWWRRRLIAIGMLGAGLVLMMGGALILLAGGRLGASTGLDGTWSVLRYPLAYLMLMLMMSLIYYALPNRDQSRARRAITLGALAGTGIWFIATIGFRFYITHIKHYGHTYGFVGAVIVLLLWMYLTAYAVLIGGEVAAAIEERGG